MVKPLAETEKQEILNAIRELGVLKAAIALRIGKTTIYRRLQQYRLEESRKIVSKREVKR